MAQCYSNNAWDTRGGGEMKIDCYQVSTLEM